jgi:hypothetical protein
MLVDIPNNQVLGYISDERIRQDEKWGQQDHDSKVWHPILAEALNRLIHGSNKEKALKDLEMELIQTAAVCVAWIESLHRNGV